MNKKQKYFERTISGYDWEKSDREFKELLANDWKIILAIPIQSGKSCHTYTSEIHYILEKESNDEEEN